MKIVNRIKNILITPRSEWSLIENESGNIAGIYKNYIGILSVIPVLAFLVGKIIFQEGSFFYLLIPAISQYVLMLVLVFGIALIIDGLAPIFGGQKNLLQALKITAYSLTASWIAVGISLLEPISLIGRVIGLVGCIYSIYLLYLGLQQITKCPPNKTPIYAAVIIVLTVFFTYIIFAIIGGWIVMIHSMLY
jgi:hypothetical protein